MTKEERETDELRFERCEPMTKSPCRFCYGICSGECSPEDFDEAETNPLTNEER